MDSSLPGNVVINGIEVDLEGDTLRRPNGATAVLRPQSFATLRYLIANANRLVSKSRAARGGLVRGGGDRRQPGAVHPCHPPSARRRRPKPAADGFAARLPAEPAGRSRDGAGRLLDRGSAVRHRGRGREPLRRRAGRGDDHRALAAAGTVRHRPELVLRLSRPGDGPAADRCGARGALPARRQRAAGGPAAAHQRPSDRRRDRGRDLGRPVRGDGRGRLRAAGRTDRADRRGARAVAAPGGDRPGGAQGARPARRLRSLPAGGAAGADQQGRRHRRGAAAASGRRSSSIPGCCRRTATPPGFTSSGISAAGSTRRTAPRRWRTPRWCSGSTPAIRRR